MGKETLKTNPNEEKDVRENVQETNPEDKKGDEKPAESTKEKKPVRIFGKWEIHAVSKEQKEAEKAAKETKTQKWGFTKAVTVTTLGLTGIAGLVKIADMAFNAFSGNKEQCNVESVPFYKERAIEGTYQDVPAPSTSSNESETIVE